MSTAAPEHRHRHRGALRVPPGPARPPGGVPRRVAVLAGLPYGHVQRIVLGRVVRAAGILGGQPHRLGRSSPRSAPPRRPRGSRTHPSAGVGRARIQQSRREPDDLLHITVGAWLMLGSTHVQRGHVAIELELLDRREGVVGRSRRWRRRVEHVVHVGDIRHTSDARRGSAACGPERVHPHEGGRVPEVGHVVRGDAAGVDASPVKQFHPLARITAGGAPAAASILVMVPVSAMRGVSGTGASAPAAQDRRPGPASRVAALSADGGSLPDMVCGTGLR
jgi:hypothetical protein